MVGGLLLFLSLAYVSSAQIAPEEICPSPFVLRGNECFYFPEDISETLNWVDSRNRCLSLGGDLAQPKDTDDFKEYISGLPIGTVPLWLGATFNEKEKQWKWISGETVKNSTWPLQFTHGYGNCMNIKYNYQRRFYYRDLACMTKSGFACEIVPGKISSISRKSFTHSSLEVDWIPPPDSKSYYTGYTLKWTDSRSQLEQEHPVTVPPHTITGLAPCANYIVTVTPYTSSTGKGEPSNNVSMSTGVDAAITGFTPISIKVTINPSNLVRIVYLQFAGLEHCKLECSRQEFCAVFHFRDRGYGCDFYGFPIPEYEPAPDRNNIPEGYTFFYMKQGCNSLITK